LAVTRYSEVAPDAPSGADLIRDTDVPRIQGPSGELTVDSGGDNSSLADSLPMEADTSLVGFQNTIVLLSRKGVYYSYEGLENATSAFAKGGRDKSGFLLFDLISAHIL
jgi:hypothetical protein